MDVNFAMKMINLLQLLLVLFAQGIGGAKEATLPVQDGNVLRLHSMDRDDHHDHAIPTSSHMEHLDPSMMVFFTLNDLKVGNKLLIYFPMQDSSTNPPLLSREAANFIPFSSKQLPDLLPFFSLSQDSPQAKAMENTLKECEIKPIKGETKHCATSLESMHDYVYKVFGSNTPFKAISTTHLIKSTTLLDNYTILDQPKEIAVPKMVACHTMPYPYTVFYCHSQETENKVFMVSLAGERGGRVEAVAVCHMDTSQWSPKHASFRVLRIKPGSSHVCHFFRGDNFVYVPMPSSMDM